ncbi:MAG: outer membrane beta-barrel protein [Gemmatimonadetes bacterium]|jgi:hypothetical protein|nr:outer membrane beta-barrel protein [Gemmatimonadota bacterium]MBK7786641.1 outer membrane beta-barrel protein [Gemmatimonadota bacterium]MBK9066046.1 outer membrane beta-barrel protein [Gemmatimonadota bacterium]
MHHPIARTAAAGLVLGLLALAPDAACAQGSTALTLFGGVYTPLGEDIDLGGVGGSVERNNSFAGGARLTFWGSGILGLEMTGAYSPAKVHVAGGVINEDRNLNAVFGSAKLMLGVSPKLAPVGFHVGAGPAVIRRGEDVTVQSESQTDFGVVVGGGVRLPMSRAIAVRIDAEDYIYKSSFGGNDETRNDLVLSAGLAFGF